MADIDPEDFKSLIEELSSSIDDLEEVLASLLETPLSETTSKLPLLDKAKLHVLLTYGFESLLFCAEFSSFCNPA